MTFNFLGSQISQWETVTARSQKRKEGGRKRGREKGKDKLPEDLKIPCSTQKHLAQNIRCLTSTIYCSLVIKKKKVLKIKHIGRVTCEDLPVNIVRVPN